jgi:phage/plasmid-like protein (TIGR03299 family)
MAPAFAVTDNLDWLISHRPLYFTGVDGKQVAWSEKVAVVREDTGRCLGAVAPSFETVQNSDLLKLIQPMVDEGVLTIENMGYLNHGARVFAQAKLNKEFSVIGEDYKGYVTLLNGHIGNASVAIGSTLTRVICGNTFAGAYSDISEKYRHSSGVTEKVLESTFILDYVNGAMGTYSKYMAELTKGKCSKKQFDAYVEAVYEKPLNELRVSFVDQLNKLFYEGAGNSGQTYHDAYQAVLDYGSNNSRQTTSGRFNYVQFGQGSRVNNRALRAGLELAAV